MDAFLRYEFQFYWLWWLCFIAIGFCTGRFFGLYGVFLAAVLISLLILGIEVHSVFKDMRGRPELGRDADFVFMVGVAFRIGLYNAFVLPFSFAGKRMRERRGVSKVSNVAEPAAAGNSHPPSHAQ
jgi:hypothetical protein